MLRLLALSLVATAALLSTSPAQAQDDCVRIKQVRAFSVQDDALVVRVGKSQFRRIAVEDACPLERADRIGFAQGQQQLYVLGRGSDRIPVVNDSIVGRFCDDTRHTYVTLIDDGVDLRAWCRIVGIQGSSRDEFEAGAVNDNRY